MMMYCPGSTFNHISAGFVFTGSCAWAIVHKTARNDIAIMVFIAWRVEANENKLSCDSGMRK
ncbi:MAG: hypothetical protein DMF19_03470 [Verrucomicrobia bacterium]|nr:MAG: hypothetical protein DMF19_03470 [Verrucomicrobiota bacterium]